VHRHHRLFHSGIRLIQPYLPRGGALEHSLIVTDWYRLRPIGTASRIGGMARYMQQRIYGTPFLALPLGFPSINNFTASGLHSLGLNAFAGSPRNL
jgi:hypothetical protein